MEKNCLQVDDDGIKYVCGDIYVKKNVSRRFMTLVMTPTFTLKQSFLPRLSHNLAKSVTFKTAYPFLLCIFVPLPPLPSPINPCFCRALHGDV